MKTKQHTKLYDITEKVRQAVKESKIKDGHVLIQPMHTTAGVYVNEAEKNLLEDIVTQLCNRSPKIKGRYLHDNITERDCPPDEPENGHSHIKATLYSNPSLSLILFKGKLQLGKYQKILFAEFDGPCPRKHKEKRKYFVSIIGE